MLKIEVTYHCTELNGEEGENACRLRIKEDRAWVGPTGRVVLDPWVMTWLEDAISALERLQGRTYIPESICDIRLAKKEA